MLARGGPDTYHGGPGADELEEDPGTGKDTIFGDGGDDRAEGGPKGDLIKGGDGDDSAGLYRRPGRRRDQRPEGRRFPAGRQGDDTLRGGRGNDTIDAASQESANGQDKVDCGKGANDQATVDANDDVRRCDGNVTVVP